MSEFPFKQDADRQLELLSRFHNEQPRRPWWRGIVHLLHSAFRKITWRSL